MKAIPAFCQVEQVPSVASSMRYPVPFAFRPIADVCDFRDAHVRTAEIHAINGISSIFERAACAYVLQAACALSAVAVAVSMSCRHSEAHW